jgi:hypothetical protein
METRMSWLYQGRIFNEEDIGNNYGFVYILENTMTGRKYIGRKYFSKAGYKQVKGKKKKVRKTSDWLEYHGSNKVVQEEVKLGIPFKKTILHLCRTRAECSYWETVEIISQGALIKEEFYNSWLSCRIHKEHLKHLMSKAAPTTYDNPEEESEPKGKT